MLLSGTWAMPTTSASRQFETHCENGPLSASFIHAEIHRRHFRTTKTPIRRTRLFSRRSRQPQQLDHIRRTYRNTKRFKSGTVGTTVLHLPGFGPSAPGPGPADAEADEQVLATCWELTVLA